MADISVKEACQLVGVSDRTIRRWLDAGHVQGRKIYGENGEEWAVDRDSLLTFARSRGYNVRPAAVPSTTPSAAPEVLQEMVEALRAVAAASDRQRQELVEAIEEKWQAELRARETEWEIERRKYEQIIHALETEIAELRRQLGSKGLAQKVRSLLKRR